jgi:hypothetical protein
VGSYAGPIPTITIDAGSAGDRDRVEAIVREAIQHRAQAEPWGVIVQLVRPVLSF